MTKEKTASRRPTAALSAQTTIIVILFDIQRF